MPYRVVLNFRPTHNVLGQDCLEMSDKWESDGSGWKVSVGKAERTGIPMVKDNQQERGGEQKPEHLGGEIFFRMYIFIKDCVQILSYPTLIVLHQMNTSNKICLRY